MKQKMQLLQGMQEAGEASVPGRPCGLAGWMPKILQRLCRESQSETRLMHLVETLPLGGKRRLMLVSCAGEHFLVGGGPESLETIVRVGPLARLRDMREKNSSGTCGDGISPVDGERSRDFDRRFPQ
ncbi:MAG TPA: flagellar biosynthetic protein FliO [Edaphobacter sp.]|nr:flagellar biosynthetic protein FliO [Edaphobacter sp.]